MRAFLLALFLASAISSNVFAATPGEVRVGNYLREAPMLGFDGKINTFADFKGKPLIINVWASWCGPCRAEMVSLDRLAHKYNGKEFNVIGISTDDDSYAAAAFIKQSGLTFENFLDEKLRLEKMLGANTIPLTIFVDANGRILIKVRGAHVWDKPQNIDAIGEVFHIRLMQQAQSNRGQRQDFKPQAKSIQYGGSI